MLRFINIAFAIWFFSILIISILALAISPNAFPHPWETISLDAIPPLARWDSGWFVSIAERGYFLQAGQSNIVFFPLYPLFIRLFHALVPFHALNFFWAGYIVAIAAAWGTCVLWYILARLDYSEAHTRRSLIFFLVFPASFFLVSVYSESLFLLFLLLSFYCARTGRWFWAIFFGALLGATRVVGIFILPALLIEFFILQKHQISWRNLLGFSLIPIPLFVFLGYCAFTFGDALLPFHGQAEYARHFNIIPLYIISYFHDALQVMNTIAQKHFYIFYDLGAFVLFGSGLLLGVLKKKIRLSYALFAFPALVLPAMSGTLTSMIRYVLVLFPVFFMMGGIERRLPRMLVLSLSIVLLIIATVAFTRWQWVA